MHILPVLWISVIFSKFPIYAAYFIFKMFIIMYIFKFDVEIFSHRLGYTVFLFHMRICCIFDSQHFVVPTARWVWIRVSDAIPRTGLPNIIVGSLNKNERSTLYILAVEHFETTNSPAVSEFLLSNPRIYYGRMAFIMTSYGGAEVYINSFVTSSQEELLHEILIITQCVQDPLGLIFFLICPAMPSVGELWR
jgi:hypothetical protein